MTKREGKIKKQRERERERETSYTYYHLNVKELGLLKSKKQHRLYES